MTTPEQRKRRSKRPPASRSARAPAVHAPPVSAPRQGFFRADDDTPIYFDVQGTGRPLVLCYGLMCRKDHWRYQIERFSQTHQVITFDYRGHQRSGRPRNDRNLSLHWVSRDIQRLLDHLGIEEAVAFGHSLGVPVLVRALSDEKRFKGAVLICGAVTDPFEHMLYTDRIKHLYRFTAMAHEHAPRLAGYLWGRFTAINRFSYQLTRQLGFNPDTAAERDVVSYMEGVTQTPFEVFQAFLRDYTQFDGRGLLPKIDIPVLVVAGEDDLITPVYLMEEMGRLLPKGELVKVTQASHNAHMDFPEEVNETIESFLKRIKFG
jgi:pimeloyl-ACP methyl ester carboxylesterase